MVWDAGLGTALDMVPYYLSVKASHSKSWRAPAWDC
jgi:hypothetical protein